VHNNYFFLRQLSSALERILKGSTLVSSFSQNKEELLLEFNDGLKSFFIKASLNSEFCCLSFPGIFNRARKNSIDLFNEILMKKVKDIHQFMNERCFSIDLEEHYALLFKMHGNRANIILFHDGIPRKIFRNHLDADFQINIAELDRDISWRKEEFVNQLTSLHHAYFTLGKPVWEYLDLKGFQSVDIETKWNLFHDTLQQLNEPKYYILEKENKLILSLLPFGRIIGQFTHPVEAVNEFFQQYTQSQAFYSEKSSALRPLREQEKNAISYISKNQVKLQELHTDQHYQALGDLVMANLHRIKAGEEKVIVENFYDNNKRIEIKLKRSLSPQKNAEVFYRKGKNQQIEIQKLKEAISRKEIELEKVKKLIAEIEYAVGLKQLRTLSIDSKKNARKKDQEEILPFHEFEFKGYKIWVGRNAESNDKLTLKYSHKEDLWLHAKDVAGSHVLIKHQSGKSFPKDVIERAAELAAYNSKRKTDSLCPVSVTPKKFVRKRKGDPAGAVVVEREDVIMVQPKLTTGD
jgi:predicted ribosome quality control (RQC) complex YloA/Tae2 family protein